MDSGKRLNDIEKGKIRAFKDLNLSMSEISRRVNRSSKVISRYLNVPESYGTKRFPGRPQKLIERHETSCHPQSFQRSLAQQET